ncbi:uncharacterized protein LOC112903890 isoform X2 [Agrilus planipennis]|uniref:Uncharacterized protein LOC108740872 isoform X3 n=1 Tax=Agrilus planipennis TaxID=224129 RepID=A0A7F5RNR1_AGRPL|nr:uncharacterized protein LOC108740872 isoform X3 [Agrilus planipennis]XP_025837571.1 uncharacterized protein LOC112903890 isoform X2 [Agrilus planipennis]
MFNQLFAIVFLALISFSYSQVVSQGQCEDRNVKPVQDFPGVNYYGANLRRWYTVYSSDSQADCESLNFTRISLTSSRISSVHKSSKSDGVVTLASNDSQGIINVKYDDSDEAVQYKILEFDYDRYTVDYNCVNVDSNNKREILYVRSRTRSIDDDIARILEILRNMGLASRSTTFVQQDIASCLP